MIQELTRIDLIVSLTQTLSLTHSVGGQSHFWPAAALDSEHDATAWITISWR